MCFVQNETADREVSAVLNVVPAMRALLTLGLGGVMAALLPSDPAHAVPAFASQTGQPCVACHIGGFGPQLTPLGRAFKIGGYTQNGGEGWRSQIPLSAYWQGSFTSLNKDTPRGGNDATPAGNTTNRYAPNNNFNIDQASIFVAGGFGDHTGIFSQWTAADDFSAFAMDNTDFRPYTNEYDIGDHELRVGISLNNNPTVQDPYNSSFAWGYPFIQPSGSLQTQPAADVILSGGFNQNSIGATVYLWYDKSLYLDAGLYVSQSNWLLTRLGNSYGVGAIQGTAPYVRGAYEWNWDEGSDTQQSAHIGAIFMNANVNPLDQGSLHDNPATTGIYGRDHYTDATIDGGYQFLGDGTHIGTVLANYTHEWQSLTGSANQYNAANGTTYGSGYGLDKVQLTGSYWYRNTYGLTLSWMGIWGKRNPVLYNIPTNAGGSPIPMIGSANNSPNSTNFIVEADWVPFGKQDSWAQPFVNLKVGLQYWAFTTFNGSSQNYDGAGRSARDNNTIYLFAWQAF
jgi:hypothetical protein